MRYEHTYNGILFTEEICSSEGASFILFPEDTHTAEDIKNAKAQLRNDRDVVSITLATASDRDYFYKGEYFRDERVRSLKWYQIEQDEKLIRRERNKGTSPADFVTAFVIPFTKEVENRNFEKSGKSIYTF